MQIKKKISAPWGKRARHISQKPEGIGHKYFNETKDYGGWSVSWGGSGCRTQSVCWTRSQQHKMGTGHWRESKGICACRKFHSRCFSWKELGRKFNSSNVHSIWDSWKSVKRRKTQRLLMPSAPNLKKQSPIECSNTNFHMEQEVGPETPRDSACWRQCWVHKGKKKMIQEDHFQFFKREL